MDFSKQEDSLQSGASTQESAPEALQERYQIVEKIHQSDFETLYLAKSQNNVSGNQYLISKLTPQYSSQTQLIAAQKLFKEEASTLQNLGTHPQVPSILDYVETQGKFFVVQELIKGQSFKEELSSKILQYSEEEAIEFLKNILPVIHFIHQNNYIHCNINPDNLIKNLNNQKIFLTNYNSIKQKINPKNLDNQGHFGADKALGTSAYTPMEQNLGKPVFCSDIYALGITVIQALTKINPTQLKYDQYNNPIWHHLLPNTSDFSPSFLEIIDRMVRCNHQKRYQSAIAVLSAIKKLKSQNIFTENTVIQQNKESTISTNQLSEQTQLINNSKTSEHFPEQTQIINNTEATKQFPENTLIIKENNLESTRIINVQPNIKYSENQQKEHKFNLKILAVIGIVLITIIVILILPKLNNKQNSTPQSFSFIY